jgi:hypothetical protein
VSQAASNAENGLACYVYYRVAPQHVGEARKALEILLDAVRTSTGVTGFASERSEAAQGSTLERTPTWMETYAPVSEPERFEQELRAAVQASGLEQFLAPGQARTLEWFSPLRVNPPCA